jgi:hypothetical protein
VKHETIRLVAVSFSAPPSLDCVVLKHGEFTILIVTFYSPATTVNLASLSSMKMLSEKKRIYMWLVKTRWGGFLSGLFHSDDEHNINIPIKSMVIDKYVTYH